MVGRALGIARPQAAGVDRRDPDQTREMNAPRSRKSRPVRFGFCGGSRLSSCSWPSGRRRSGHATDGSDRIGPVLDIRGGSGCRMGRGKRQVNVTYEICLRITPTLDQRILEGAGVLLLKLHARQIFPDGRWRGGWLRGLLRRGLLSHCRTAAEHRCSDPQRDKQLAMLWRHELIRAAR